jgi:hypothetical protein
MKYITIIILALLISCIPKKFSYYKYDTFQVIYKDSISTIVNCLTCKDSIQIYMINTDSVHINDIVQFIEEDGILYLRRSHVDKSQQYNNIPKIKRKIKFK